MDLLAAAARPRAEAGEELTGSARARVLLAAALGPLVTGYAAVAALFALVTAVAPRASFSATGVLAAAGPGWLAAYQVPLDIGGVPLGVLPLAPTIGVCFLVARAASGAAQRLGYTEPGQCVTLIGVLAGAHAAAGGTIALLTKGEPLSVEPLAAFLVPAVVSGVAAAAGATPRCGLAAYARDRLDPLALHGVRTGALGFAALLAAGALTVTVGTILSVPTVHRLFEENAPGTGSGLGMLLLAIGYVPNAVVLALGFAIGPGFELGSVSVSPFSFEGGSVPGLPLLAALPEEYAAWWPAFLLLPAAAGALVGWSSRRGHDDPVARLRAVGMAGAVIGFGLVVLGTLAGGRLGAGSLDPVAMPVGLASIAAFCWIAVPGGLVAWFAGPHRRRPPEPEPVSEQAEDVEDAAGEGEDEAGEQVDAEADEPVPDELGAEVDDEEPEPDAHLDQETDELSDEDPEEPRAGEPDEQPAGEPDEPEDDDFEDDFEDDADAEPDTR